MAVQCPFCGDAWTDSLITHMHDATEGEIEDFQCECGAWWYEGMDDVGESDD
jgi:hypothetical protein